MRKEKVIAVAIAALAAVSLMGCSPRSSMSTLSIESDSEASSVFSLTKVLDLGTNYLVSLDYDNAILQYIDIIQHDPKNKEAYAGLYAAYAAQGKVDEANDVFSQAQEVFESDADFLSAFLDDASLIFENGGGNGTYQLLSDHYWDDTNSIFARDVGDAWLAAEPQNVDAYALLGAHYASIDDENGIETLLQNAEQNGVDFNAINTKIEKNSDGTSTLTLQIDNFMQSESGEKTSVQVEIKPTDNAKTTTQKVAEKVADNAASKVVEQSGLTGEAASLANSMAQEALRKGLGGSAPAPSQDSASSIAAPAYDPAQDTGAAADDFDWSEITSEFPDFNMESVP